MFVKLVLAQRIQFAHFDYCFWPSKIRKVNKMGDQILIRTKCAVKCRYIFMAITDVDFADFITKGKFKMVKKETQKLQT